MKTIKGALVVVAMWGAAACTGGTDEPAPGNLPASNAPPGADPGAEAPEPPAATETPRESELTEQFGVFVVEGGADGAPGTRAEPMGSIGAAILKAKANKRRVYVCGGTYKEALALEDGISVIGGYACGSTWQLGGKRATLEAPVSPAVIAKNISKSTRFDGFSVIAPDGSPTERSSIALLADNAGGLTIASSALHAGRGADGADGVAPAPAVHLSNPNGQEGAFGGRVAAILTNAQLFNFLPAPYARDGAAGGAAACSAGPQPEAGGRGEGSELRQGRATQGIIDNVIVAHGKPRELRTGEAGITGDDGASGASPTLTAEGFVAGDGAAGTDGGAGFGGSGGSQKWFPAPFELDTYWWSASGGGGGAGGCAGLAGTAGQGGGASAAAVVLRSPAMVLSDVTLEAADGGRGGAGSFGSEPSEGGHWGGSPMAPVAESGGRGGIAGTSGAGAGGPSIALAHVGGAPKQDRVTAKHGAGGAGVAARSKTTFGVAQTISATSAGDAADVSAF